MVEDGAMMVLAGRLEAVLAEREAIEQGKMFGGVAFLMRGYMLACANRKGRLLLAVGKDNTAAMLGKSGVSPMLRSGKPIRGFVYVEPDAIGDDHTLKGWLRIALNHVERLPPKEGR